MDAEQIECTECAKGKPIPHKVEGECYGPLHHFHAVDWTRVRECDGSPLKGA